MKKSTTRAVLNCLLLEDRLVPSGVAHGALPSALPATTFLAAPGHRPRLPLTHVPPPPGGTQFQSLLEPVGVTTDSASDVFVSCLDPSTDAPIVAKFDSLGNVIVAAYVPAGDPLSPGYLYTYPGDIIIYQSDDGTLLEFSDDLTRYGILANLRNLPTDATHIFDVITRQYHNFGGTIQPYSALYGDFTVSFNQPYEDWFITGFSNGLPFVDRLHFVNQQFQSASVVTASAGDYLGQFPYPPGVTANAGVVLTTLTDIDQVDKVYAFAPEFPEGHGAPPTKLSDVGVASKGMKTDPAGNYLMAIGQGISPLCQGNPGYVVVTSDLSTMSCVEFGGPSYKYDFLDIAALNFLPIVYLTDLDSNVVWDVYDPYEGPASRSGQGQTPARSSEPTTAAPAAAEPATTAALARAAASFAVAPGSGSPTDDHPIALPRSIVHPDDAFWLAWGPELSPVDDLLAADALAV